MKWEYHKYWSGKDSDEAEKYSGIRLETEEKREQMKIAKNPAENKKVTEDIYD
jgi:hypothetical protein